MHPAPFNGILPASGFFRITTNFPLRFLVASALLYGTLPANAGTKTVDGVVYSDDMTKIVKYPADKTDRLFVVPESVVEVGANCFSNRHLVAVQFLGDCPAADKTSFVGSSCAVYRYEEKSGWPERDYGRDLWWDDAEVLVTAFPHDLVKTLYGTDYHFEIVDGVLFSFQIIDGKAHLHYVPNDSGGWSGQGAIPHSIAGTVRVPETLGRCPVTSVGGTSFGGKATSVVLPETVTSIAGQAFNSSYLASVSFPSSLRSISPYPGSPFWGCTALEAITIPESNSFFKFSNGCLLDKSGESLYAVIATKEGSFSVPSGVKRIENYAFDSCGKITSISVPDSVTSIGRLAFYSCSKLTSVSISDSVTSIGSQSFEYCSSLQSINIPDGITTIENSLFFGCRSLAAVTIPNSVTRIGSQAFQNCSSLTNISIPTGVTSIGCQAFQGCSGLTEISIPDSVIDLGDTYGNKVFANCTGLKKLIVPGDWEGTTILSDASVPDDCEVEYRPITRISIVFNASGGICATDQATFKLGRSFGQLPVATRTGHSFGGWFTERDGQGTRVTAESLVEAGISTLYAKWTPKPYTVKFSANGGTGTMSAQKMAYGSSAKLRKNAFTREGFVFLGWAKSKTGSVVYGDQANVKNLSSSGGSVTLYAQWAKKTYAVAFDANGGTLPKGKTMAPQKMAYGKAAALQANAFTRKGYVFYGWSRSKTGKREFANKAEVKNLRTDGKTQTLFAVWAKESYLVSFDANGGKGKMAAQKMTFGKASNLAKNAFTKKGWLFAGWAKSAELAKNGKVAYKNGASVKNLRTDGKTTTLYAVWEKAQTVKFDANGGTCAPAEKYFRVGKAYGSFPTPEWKWRTFLGWFTASDGGDWVAETDVAETTTSRKLFAHWESIPVRLGETTKTVGPDAAAKLSVALSAKTDWTATADAAWIAVRTKSGASGSGSLVFDVAKNAGAARTGRIIVSAGGKVVVLTVSQKARTLALSASKKVFKAKAATGQKLGVTATVAWTAKSSAKWLTVKTAKGTGNGTIVYELAANKGAGRAATITVSGGGKKATFRVEQKGPDGSEPVAEIPAASHYLQVSPARQTFESGSTNEIAVVNADLAWTASTANDWIELDEDTKTGSGSGILRYRVEENDDGTNRTGKIAVAASGLKATLAVEQAAKGRTLYLCVMPTNRIATAAAANDTVWVEANVAWTAGSGDDWIDLRKTSGNGSGSLSYSMAANTATTNRTGTITVFGGGLAAEFTLTQKGKTSGTTGAEEPVTKYLRVNPASREHGHPAQTAWFQIEANVDWRLTPSANWIVPGVLSGANYKTVSYTLAENTTTNTRTGWITVTGSGVPSATFMVIQRGSNGEGGGDGEEPGSSVVWVYAPSDTPPRPAKTITIAKFDEKFEFPAEASGPWSCSVTTKPSDMTWVASNNGASWLELLTPKPGEPSYGQTVEFRLKPNESRAARTTFITVRRHGAVRPSDKCKIVQKGKVPFIQADPTRFPAGSGRLTWKGVKAPQTVGVTANVDWSAAVATADRAWIKITKVFKTGMTEDGLNNGTISFTVEQNKTGVPREGHILVSGGGAKTVTITVAQEKGTILKISGKTIPYEADRYSLRVGANVDWKLSVLRIDPFPDGNWLVIPKKWKQGSGNAVVEFKVTENNTGRKRTVDVRLTGGGTNATATITQLPKPILKVLSPSTKEPVKVSYKKRVNPGYAVSVKSNIKWKATAKSEGGWLTLTPQQLLAFKGSKTASFEFNVAKNGTGKDRKGKIVLTGKGVKPVTIIVIQKKAPLLKISPASNTVSYRSASSWFYVTSDVKWTAKSSTAKTDNDWLHVKKVHVDKTGTKNGGYVEYTADANKKGEKRSAKITVTGGGKTVVFTLTQKAKPLPNLCFYKPSDWPKAAFVTDVASEYEKKEQTRLTAYRDESAHGAIYFAWKNTGGCDAGRYRYKVVCDNGDPEFVTESGLAARKTKNNAFVFYSKAEGEHTVTITLDPDNAIKESNEKDNTATVTFTIVYSDESAYGGLIGSSAAYDYSYDAPPTEEFIDMKPEAPVIEEEPAKAKWVAVVASGGEDAGAVADGDEETAWTPDAAEGAWCVLTFPEPVDATNAELVGDGLPEGTRILFSEDSENWHEKLPVRVQYVWAVFPASDEPFAVREIRLLSK